MPAAALHSAQYGDPVDLPGFHGHERVRHGVEAAGPDPDRRWQAYLAFISTP